MAAVSEPKALEVGDKAPAFNLRNQSDESVRLSSFVGRKVLVFFYPKANTPGCTTQACGLRDVADTVGDTVIVGISPDMPDKLANFDDKHSLGFTLLSDPDHSVAEKYGVWGEKKLYGKAYMGIIRSAFLIDEKGRLERVWYKISPKDTPKQLLSALG
jgi:thioredoxin-dependent peroxiredoxin